ncbi:hypothetical protein [Sinomonas susongensis]|uniref:hypothetical protein n=1 Tax=Sinomonas susongensis TaxID=1324851 RepID=UPI001109A2B9|nr:hypothetical protein [Sinomonas susongensis]
MADHVAETSSTQAQFPGRAALRTFMQVILPAAVGFGVLVPVIVSTFLGVAGNALPGGFVAWLTAASVAVGGVAAGIARVMASPAVVAWTQRYLPWLAPQPTDPKN